MTVSVRSHLIAGMAAVTVCVVAIPTSVEASTVSATPAPRAHVLLSPRIDLAAATRPFVVESPDPQEFAQARAAIDRIDPTSQVAAILAKAPTAAAAAGPVGAAYGAIQGLVDFGVEVAVVVLRFVPGIAVTGNQIDNFYFNLIRPIANSIVYGLLGPVLANPFNVNSYVSGLIAVVQTALTAVVNTAVNVVTGTIAGLIPFPFNQLIPQLPAFPLPFAAATAQLTAPSVADDQPTDLGEAAHRTATVDDPGTDDDTAPTVTDETKGTEGGEDTPEPSQPATTPTTTSANGIQAQGEVRTGTQTITTASDASDTEAESTAGPGKDTADITDTDTTDANTSGSAPKADDAASNPKADRTSDAEADAPKSDTKTDQA